MRWTVVDAGTSERLNDVIEDARGRWWIAGDVVRVSDDRGATWRVAHDQWTRALAVDGDMIWAGGSELHCCRDGRRWRRARAARRRRRNGLTLRRARSN